MKSRIKGMLIGLGFTFGLQVIISLIFTGFAFAAARSETGASEGWHSLVFFGLTLGAFLVGGFVLGWMEESPRIVDALIVAAITLALSALIYSVLPQGNKGQFITGQLLSGGADQISLNGRGMLFVLLALAAAPIGAYLGYRQETPEEGRFDRIALLVGLIGAVVGPFILLAVGGRGTRETGQPELPWYVLAIVLVVLLVIVGVGFVMFTRESHYEEEISISPETRREH
jgi:MFS family permease